jgi:putative ubiquitin-RnfH superfamily antitoxin RatB of RatAB toxin-antitoxin module
MADRGLIEVEVACALPQRESVVTLTVADGTTVEEVIGLAGILAQFPEIDVSSVSVGIFGKRVARKKVVSARDRIEIYRPLLADPKQARRKRALGARRAKC